MHERSNITLENLENWIKVHNKRLDLFDKQILEGELNKAKISVEVFGSKGGHQYKKIDEVLEKFGRV